VFERVSMHGIRFGLDWIWTGSVGDGMGCIFMGMGIGIDGFLRDALVGGKGLRGGAVVSSLLSLRLGLLASDVFFMVGVGWVGFLVAALRVALRCPAVAESRM